MEGSEYYESLIQQGYSSEQAEQYTAQHYPGFTIQQTPLLQDSVVGGNLHSGDVIHHHHHAAPVIQAAPVQATVLVSPQSVAQPALIPRPNKKVHVVPWIGVGLIFMMLFMPFVQLSFEGENLNSKIVSFNSNLRLKSLIGLTLRFVSIVALIFLSSDIQYDLK